MRSARKEKKKPRIRRYTITAPLIKKSEGKQNETINKN
jgi:hypothetical protein